MAAVASFHMVWITLVPTARRAQHVSTRELLTLEQMAATFTHLQGKSSAKVALLNALVGRIFKRERSKYVSTKSQSRNAMSW